MYCVEALLNVSQSARTKGQAPGFCNEPNTSQTADEYNERRSPMSTAPCYGVAYGVGDVTGEEVGSRESEFGRRTAYGVQRAAYAVVVRLPRSPDSRLPTSSPGLTPSGYWLRLRGRGR